MYHDDDPRHAAFPGLDPGLSDAPAFSLCVRAMPRGSFARSSSRSLDACCSEGGGGGAAAASSSSSVTVCEVVAEAVSADQVRRLVGKVSKQSTASLFPRP